MGDWPVVQHRRSIHTGDRVYFWLTGRDAGIYGAGHALAEPVPSAATPLSSWHVSVAHDHVLTAPLLRRALRQHPLLKDLAILRQPQGTNFRVDEEQARELERLLGLAPPTAALDITPSGQPAGFVAETATEYAAAVPHSPGARGALPPFRPEHDTLRGGMLLPDEPLETIATLIDAGRHLIISGPPGAGKTTLALAAAGEGRRLGYCATIVVTTATADWTTFDTIGGYLPGRDGVLAFHEGVVLRALRQDAWLVLDEINRADIDRAFGAFLTVLSGHNVELPFVSAGGRPIHIISRSGQPHSRYDEQSATYHVGSAWRILATMNTLDRQALFALSLALARRFAVVRLDAPSPSLLREIAATVDVAPPVRETVLALFAHSPRPLGAALLLDMLTYIAARHDPQALAEAVEAYLLPQLDGLDAPRLRRYAADLKRLAGKPYGERLAASLRDLFRLEEQ